MGTGVGVFVWMMVGLPVTSVNNGESVPASEGEDETSSGESGLWVDICWVGICSSVVELGSLLALLVGESVGWGSIAD